MRSGPRTEYVRYLNETWTGQKRDAGETRNDSIRTKVERGDSRHEDGTWTGSDVHDADGMRGCGRRTVKRLSFICALRRVYRRSVS